LRSKTKAALALQIGAGGLLDFGGVEARREQVFTQVRSGGGSGRWFTLS
jgi:hypothetical protein